MTRAQEKPPVRGGSTATINRLRQAMAESAAARAGRAELRPQSAPSAGESYDEDAAGTPARPLEPAKAEPAKVEPSPPRPSTARSSRPLDLRHRLSPREALVEPTPEPKPQQPDEVMVADDYNYNYAQAIADQEPPRTERHEDQAADEYPATTAAPARDEMSEHDERLALLRRMTRRLAAESREVGDLRRIDRTVAARPAEADIEAGETAALSPRDTTRPRRSATMATDRPQPTPAARPGHIEPAEADAGPFPMQSEPADGARTRDELQKIAPAGGYPHDARDVLTQVGRAPGKRLPVIIGLVAIMLSGAVAVGAYRLFGAPALVPARSAAAPQRPALASEPIVEAAPARSAPLAAALPPAPIVAAEPAVIEPQPSPAAIEQPVERPLAAAPVEAVPPAAPAAVGGPLLPEPSAGPRLTAAQVRQVRSLMANGKSRLAGGDVTSARALYQRAAELGDGAAAFALAETFDPAALSRNGITGVRADVAAARRWYRLASDRGVADAKTALARLKAPR